MVNVTSICEGTFIGHAVASQYDPSVFMAFNISESLLKCGRFNGTDIFSRHMFWYHTGKSEVGAITKFLYKQAIERLRQNNVQTISSIRDFAFTQATIDEMVQAADKHFQGRTAGCNPAQRSFPLALCPFISDEDLFDVTIAEARLTHFNPIAGQVAGILNLILRHLINGQKWFDAVDMAFRQPGLHRNVSLIAHRYHRWATLEEGIDPAFAPAVLNAALHHVNKNSNPAKAIADAHENDKFYCSPIVGVLAGARWGIGKDLLENSIKDSQLRNLRTIAIQLSDLWEEGKDAIQA